MTTEPATPLPWIVNQRNRIIAAADYRAIANCVHGINAEQDAAYIVHACNAYPRLVEALREARNEMRETWQKSNALRDSVAAGNMMRRFDEVLRELGE